MFFQQSVPGLGRPPEAPHRTGRKDARFRAAWQRAGESNGQGFWRERAPTVPASLFLGIVAILLGIGASLAPMIAAQKSVIVLGYFSSPPARRMRLRVARTRLEPDSPNDLFCAVEPSRGNRAVARHLRSGDVGGEPFRLRACGQWRLPYGRGVAKPAIEKLAGLTTCRFRIADWSGAPSHVYGG